MKTFWDREKLSELARSYQPVCVLAAACDWNVFGVLADRSMTTAQLAGRLRTDPRATGVLLDALAALDLLHKQQDQYLLPDELRPWLVGSGPSSLLPMLQHQGNCLRRWAQLSTVVRTGRPVPRQPSARGEAADLEAFIEAMNVICEPVADQILAEVSIPPFSHLLDVGGGSGTWTIAFLRAHPQAKATLFDLTDVIPQAQRRLKDAGLLDRVKLAAGDFYIDPLPKGADLIWLSAIVHQNSREQNRELFRKIHAVLQPGGSVLIRDIVMNDDHTQPAAGALFAINMLVGTEGGGTFSLDELTDDLQTAGFGDVNLLRSDEGMNAIVRAGKR